MTIRFAVEGMYVVRSKSIHGSKPNTWVRDWAVWQEVPDIETARKVKATGLKIMDPKEWSGFNELRIVQITEHKEIVE